MQKLKNVNQRILSVLNKGDILFIVPPFVSTRTPILGPHILQAVAKEEGYNTKVLYLNLLLASIIGTDLYESISYNQPFRMLGERLFARSAYKLPPLGKEPGLLLNPAQSVFGNEQYYPLEEFEYKFYNISDFDLDSLLKIEEICQSLIIEVNKSITSLGYKIVACSTNWEQNNCCIALINGLKKIQPDIITIIGGANCEEEMAEGIASLSDSIDYIFSGESEDTFAYFLEKYSAGELPSQHIVTGEPVEDLNNIPLPDYENYFKQIESFFTDNPPKGIVIGYETSRGCWWGQCNFCGLNGARMVYRQKVVKKVIDELDQINSSYPGQRILIIDKVMPTSYQEELLPLLYEKENYSPITCEQRSNLELHELIRLKKAKINIIKFGIEALSTGLLNIMNKGVTAIQNILLLRNAASLGLLIDWFLLWGFPGDKAIFYEETLRILPLIRHLNPPALFRHLSLDRFCTYFRKREDFQINALRPWSVYHTVYPDWANVSKLAYRFIGDYPCEAHEHLDLIREIAKEIVSWKKEWRKANLTMTPFCGYYIISDSRYDKKNKHHTLDISQAKEVMTPCVYDGSEFRKWALDQKLGVVIDSWYVPLVTASPELLLEFEEEQEQKQFN